MQRIAIIGCGGSGKSRLAARLGEALDLPVIHLDCHYWLPGWREMDKVDWRAWQERQVQEPRWIMDGNYGGTLDLRLAACDTVIFLDLPTLVCLWGVVRRYLSYRDRSRPSIAPGCDERLPWTFLYWIVTYRRQRRPGILQRLAGMRRDQRVVTLTSRRAIGRFLQDLNAAHSATPAD